MKSRLTRSPPRSIEMSVVRPWGLGIATFALSPVTLASTMPARVLKESRSLSVMPFNSAKRAAQRAPLPHISATEPSALKNRHAKSASGSFSIRIRPSAPAESFLRQASRARSCPYSSGTLRSRLSIIKKSFPLPVIFVNGILCRVWLTSGSLQEIRDSFGPHEIFPGLSSPDHKIVSAIYQDLRSAAPGVVIGRHAKSVCSGAHHSEIVALIGHGQAAVPCQKVPDSQIGPTTSTISVSFKFLATGCT